MYDFRSVKKPINHDVHPRLTVFWIAVQLYTGIVVLFALLKAKHTPKPKVIKFLLLHLLMMELVNITSFITTIFAFMWCLGPYSPPEVANVGAGSIEWVQFFERWLYKWLRISYASNTAFILGGLLTDGILVSTAHNKFNTARNMCF